LSWTLRSAPSGTTDSKWLSITYGNGTYVATAYIGTFRVMTSPDAVTWTRQSAVSAQAWGSVTFGDGLFVAVSNGGSGDRVMTSTDGITWTGTAAASQQSWVGVTYGSGQFVAVANYAGTDGVMTSSAIIDPVLDPSQWTVVGQGLPMPDSGICSDLDDTDYAWGTGLTGGWRKGWEPWVISGDSEVRGGWACIRTLVNTGGDRWILGD